MNIAQEYYDTLGIDAEIYDIIENKYLILCYLFTLILKLDY